MRRVELLPLPTEARVQPGDDLADLVLEAARGAGVTLQDGDVVCVASKVVSKAEGAFADLPAAADVHAARRRLTEEQAVRVVADTPWVLVVETRHGFVCANAGIDTSNVEGGRALLLPADPDGAARDLAAALAERGGVRVGVVVTDTFGRPWRMGQTDVALGAAGIVALRDERGSTDLEGRTLEVTMVAVADELAAAADLARRKADGTPFVVVRGAEVAGEGRGADLLRPAAEDTFRYGGPTAVARALEDRGVSRAFTADPVDPAVLDGAARLAATSLGSGGTPAWRMLRVAEEQREEFASAGRTLADADALADAPEVVVVVGGEAIAVGAAAQTFQVALRAHGLASDWVALDADAARGALGGALDEAAEGTAGAGEEPAAVWGAVVIGHPASTPRPLTPPQTSPLHDARTTT